MQFVVANMKGGVGKTTSAVCLALALSRQGRTLLVDGDPQGSALSWSTLAGEAWPLDSLTLVSWSGPDIARRVRAVEADYQHIVIDTGPAAHTVVRGALAVTGRLLIPVSPRGLDVAEIKSTFQLASEIDAVRDVYASVLLTQVRQRTRAATDTRDVLNELGYPLLETEIPLREHFAQMYGTVPTDLGEYEKVLAELQENEQ